MEGWKNRRMAGWNGPSRLPYNTHAWQLVANGMEVEARWKWKLDGSGSSMEVEARWKWKPVGSGSSMEVEARWKWKLDRSGSPLEILYSLVDC